MEQRKSFTLDSLLAESRSKMLQTKEASASNDANTEDVNFDQILGEITGESKTASAQGDGAVDLSNDQVKALLQQKVAEFASVNQSRQLKEAQLIGAAVFDGYLARAAEREYHSSKIAAALEMEHPEVEKIAEEIGYNQGIKVAWEIAQREIAEGEKVAAERLHNMKVACYNAGHVDTLKWLSSFGE